MAVPSNWKRLSLARRLDQLAGHFYSDATVGTPGSQTGLNVTEYMAGPLHKTVITMAADTVTVADDAGVAQYGGAGLIYTFPTGVVCTLGCVIDGTVTMGATGTIIATWAGGIALGTAAATTGATLVSTEATWMAEVDVAAATASVAVVDGCSVATQVTESGARWYNGTTTPGPVYLNLVIDDDASHTAATGTFTGTVTIHWILLGDY